MVENCYLWEIKAILLCFLDDDILYDISRGGVTETNL